MTSEIPYKQGELVSIEQLMTLALFFLVVIVIALVLRKKKSVIFSTQNEDIQTTSRHLSRHTVLHVVHYKDQEHLIVESDKNIIKIEK